MNTVELVAQSLGVFNENATFEDAVSSSMDAIRALRQQGLYKDAAGANAADYLGRLAQFWEGDIAGIPNKPGPLSSMLVLAPLGATAGLAAGYLGNKLTGGHAFNNLWTPALAGAAAGLVPGLAYAGLNAAAGQPAFTSASWNFPKLDKVGFMNPTPDAPAIFPTVKSLYIPVDQLKEMIYRDPNVAPHIPPHIQAATIGLVEGAQNLPGRKYDLPIITPFDVARMAVGLGTGYASGALAGTILGGMFGLSDSAKDMMKSTGMFAGLINSVVPMVYGAR
jgi:hypothetical protein